MDRFFFCGKDVTDEVVQKTIYSINRFKVGDKVFVIKQKYITRKPLKIKSIKVLLYDKAFTFRYLIGSKYYGLSQLWKKQENARLYQLFENSLRNDYKFFRNLVKSDEKGLTYKGE